MKLLIVFFVLSLNGVFFAQETWKCATDELGNKLNLTLKKGTSINPPKRNDKYIIPVVFHVLHKNGVENVSDEQIKDALVQINLDFAGLNSDTIDVVPEFKGKIAKTNVEFRLAKKDPIGLATSGINRFFTTYTDSGIINTPELKINQWPPTKYLNIWVCRSLNGQAAAYSWFPEFADVYPELDGIVVQHDYLGTIGTGGKDGRHVMTHEIGHYLNLKHPFNDIIFGDCGDDEVEDTPITSSSGCILSKSDCSPGVIENVQNFMTGSFCFVMFTEGQKKRMIASLNSSSGGRNKLWISSNLKATGVLNTADVVAELRGNCVVYPNPATQTLNIELNITEQLEAYILDESCRKVWSGVLNDTKNTISLQDLSAGIYHFVVVKDGTLVQEKLVVTN